MLGISWRKIWRGDSLGGVIVGFVTRYLQALGQFAELRCRPHGLRTFDALSHGMVTYSCQTAIL
jgi:hypothetical protein